MSHIPSSLEANEGIESNNVQVQYLDIGKKAGTLIVHALVSPFCPSLIMTSSRDVVYYLLLFYGNWKLVLKSYNHNGFKKPTVRPGPGYKPVGYHTTAHCTLSTHFYVKLNTR
jgi:hypothetical protein